ncbi:MAG: tRNA threonylcarbamoyladenosine dehydratase [bacterium]|nr:tRNA threonylcarbamoyladenosine dehydratase [bacterium]
MKEAYSHRTLLLLGEEAAKKLSQTRVILFGVGGVGSWCAESLVRSGIGQLTIVDSDRVCATNINRQLQATASTVGEVKVETLKKRLLDINPDAEIEAAQRIYSKETSASFNLDSYDYIIDAIDSLSNKIHLIETALECRGTLFASMGAALKLDPSRIQTAGIWKTEGCPLAREVRKALRKRRINKNFLCVFSNEMLPRQNVETACGSADCVCPKSENGPGDPGLTDHEWCSLKAQINGSIAHITAIFGFTIAGLVIQSVVDQIKNP